jgi:hypothetical protein
MKGAAAEQIRVAITDTPGGGPPALVPPARTNHSQAPIRTREGRLLSASSK